MAVSEASSILWGDGAFGTPPSTSSLCERNRQFESLLLRHAPVARAIRRGQSACVVRGLPSVDVARYRRTAAPLILGTTRRSHLRR